jgi:hypothetical protein
MSRRRNLLSASQEEELLGYKYYRLTIVNTDGTPFIAGSGSAPYLYHVVFYSDFFNEGNEFPSPRLTSETSNPNFIISGIDAGRSNQGPFNAFDSNTNTGYWVNSPANPLVLDIELNQREVFKSITLRDVVFQNITTNYLLEGSNVADFSVKETVGTTGDPANFTLYNFSFLTVEHPTPPNNIIASNLTTNSATLTCDVSTSLNDTITSYSWFEGSVLIASTTTNSVDLTGLVSNKSFSIRCQANDNLGRKSNFSDIVTFQTLAEPFIYTSNLPTGSYNFYRFQGIGLDGNINSNRMFIFDLKLFEGLNETGIEFPTTDLTSNTSESGIVISTGYTHSETYVEWKAFDSNINGGWWTIGNSIAANNWIEIEFATAKEIKSLNMKVSKGANQTLNHGYQILVSNTGAFAGEEILIGTVSNLLQGGATALDSNFNL